MSCISPFSKKHNGETLSLPCGKCTACRSVRVSGWSFRLQKQAEISDFNYFVTLTYNGKTAPRTKNNLKTILKDDLQRFFKRYRKRIGRDYKVKYYACGEYGTNTKRPHYHIILLIAYDHDHVHDPNSLDYRKHAEQLKADIDLAWNKGYIHIGRVTPASTAYTLKYISKDKQIPMHEHDDRVPEFSLMSKGMGANYLTKAMKAWHLADLENRFYIPMENGSRIRLPRYYKDKIYSQFQRQRVSAYFQDPEAYRQHMIHKAELGKVPPEYIKRLTLKEAHKSYDQILKEMNQENDRRLALNAKALKHKRIQEKL